LPSISVPTAVIGASVIGGAANAIGAGSAASAQKAAAQAASNTEQNMFNQAAGYEQPFIQGGQAAYGTLNNLLGVGGNSETMQNTLNNLPGYQFTLGQGLKSVQNSAAARGLGDSGAALKGAANYATGLANSQYGNYVGQLQNSAGLGANAANALAGQATTVGSNIASNQLGAGNAAAAQANATGGAVSGAVNNIGQYYTLNGLLNNGAFGGGGGQTTGPLFGWT
jgi:hypothetical protein